MKGNERHAPHRIASCSFCVFLSVALGSAPLFSQSEHQQQKEQPKGAASLTGCVDEISGRYVLIDAREMHPIAELEAVGFPNEGFAKYVGQKVTVRGSSDSGSDKPLFRVRSIETISESCTPEDARKN